LQRSTQQFDPNQQRGRPVEIELTSADELP